MTGPDDRSASRRAAHHAPQRFSGVTGNRSETIAAWLLRFRGYRILARRFRAGSGEIDLIAVRRDVIAFVEVKARRRMDDAVVAITPDKRRRIASAARVWLARHPRYAQHTLRLDAVFVSALSFRPAAWRALRMPRHEINIAPLEL